MTELPWHRAGAAFDTLAPQYDDLWTRSTVGRLQRDAVWRRADTLFHPGDRLLDLGCGTGEDALHFMATGISVRAIDASPEMVRVAQARGVDASVLGIEGLQSLTGIYDGAFSNFGALNCVADLNAVSASRGTLIRPGGYLALCVLGRFCLWELAWYLLRGQPRKSMRRWRSGRTASSLNLPVHHFSIDRIQRAFYPKFESMDWRGIGFATPPSYVSGVPEWLLRVFGKVDRGLAHRPLIRALADHRLIVLKRAPG